MSMNRRRALRAGLRGILGLMAMGAACAWGCASGGGGGRAWEGLSGQLVLIGGALDDQNEPVFKRLLELARDQGGTPRVVVATAASLNEEPAFASIVKRMRAYGPGAEITMINRETAPMEAVTKIEAARLVFFTGGDQKRIVDLYRKDGVDGVEAKALRGLLARGGTIAGTSAGDAMMSDPMFLTGGSDEALGMVEGKGVQIGTGMGFLPEMIADSHFFERDRLGRLVAALEKSGRRWGVGVGEDAAVEVDLAQKRMRRISQAGVLLVDAGGLRREGLARRGVAALLLEKDVWVSLKGLGVMKVEKRAGPVMTVTRSEGGPAAQWSAFSGGMEARELTCGKHVVRVWGLGGVGGGWSGVEIEESSKRESGKAQMKAEGE